VLVALVWWQSARVAAQEWPQFRGPAGQGHATAAALPLEWSETKNVSWKVPVPGTGWSSPVVGNGLIWLTTAVERRDERGRRTGGVSLRALAYDAATGAERVNVEVFSASNPNPRHQKNSYASPTPILDGDRVYVHFGAEGTAALSSAGAVLWKTQFAYESQHGNGGSPLLYRDLLIINCDGGDQAFVVALDTKTGKTRWRKNRRAPADQAYTTPLAITVNNVDQVISVGAYRAVSYNPINGDEIWRVSYDNGFSNVPRPVFGKGLVFIATGFQQPTMIAVRADGTGDVTRSHLAWTLTRGAPFTPSPLLVGDDLYVLNDSGILTLVEAVSGRIVWQQRLGGNYAASPVFAAGRIYFQSEEGITTAIAPGRTYRKLATNTLDGAMLASMAVLEGAVVIRTDTHLYRIQGT
jgi:outer membrane protein assembly factor BamB